MKVKIVLLVASIFLAFILFTSLDKSLALLETNGKANQELSIAKWDILINSNSVKLSNTLNLTDFTIADLNHVESGVFAPGTTGYYDLVIDPHLSETAIYYTISLDYSNFENHENIVFSVSSDDIVVTSEDNIFTGVIPLEDLDELYTIRVTATWYNDEDYDESDTLLIGKTIPLIVDVNFEQYTGE